MDSQRLSGKRGQSSRSRDRPLEFITFTDPDSARSAANQHRVRSQAMRDFHRRADAPKRRRNEIELDITPLLQQSTQNDSSLLEAQHNQDSHQGIAYGEDTGAVALAPVTTLCYSRVDPFFQYPIKMGHRERELYDHLYDETCIMFRTMRDFGYLNLVRQTAAFCQMLAMSSWHLAHLNQHEQTTDHLQYSLVATQALQKQLIDPMQCITDDAVGAVLAFAICANLVHDPVALKIHLDGLTNMLHQRGGLQTLDSNPLLRIMLYWVDINGAYYQDISPRFPPPEHLLPKPTNFQREFRLQLAGQGSNGGLGIMVISGFCKDIRDVQDVMHNEMGQRHLWKDTVFAGFYISPILGDLLAVRLDIDNEPNSSTMLLETFRLAAVLYVSDLRSKFGIDTLPAGPLYATKLQAILSRSSTRDWEAQTDLLIWILAIAFTSQSLFPEQRAWFTWMFSNALTVGGISEFEGLKALLTRIVWDEEILDIQSRTLESLFCSMATETHLTNQDENLIYVNRMDSFN